MADDVQTVDWHDYLHERGFIEAKIEAAALGPDLATVVGEAIIEVCASEGEFDGVTYAFELGGPEPHYASVWFPNSDARTFVNAIATALGATVASTQVPALSPDDEPEEAVAEVAASADHFGEDIYLDMTVWGERWAVLVTRDAAADVARAVTAAVDYLVEHGYE